MKIEGAIDKIYFNTLDVSQIYLSDDQQLLFPFYKSKKSEEDHECLVVEKVQSFCIQDKTNISTYNIVNVEELDGTLQINTNLDCTIALLPSTVECNFLNENEAANDLLQLNSPYERVTSSELFSKLRNFQVNMSTNSDEYMFESDYLKLTVEKKNSYISEFSIELNIGFQDDKRWYKIWKQSNEYLLNYPFFDLDLFFTNFTSEIITSFLTNGIKIGTYEDVFAIALETSRETFVFLRYESNYFPIRMTNDLFEAGNMLQLSVGEILDGELAKESRFLNGSYKRLPLLRKLQSRYVFNV